jgi:hypothetical protein
MSAVPALEFEIVSSLFGMSVPTDPPTAAPVSVACAAIGGAGGVCTSLNDVVTLTPLPETPDVWRLSQGARLGSGTFYLAMQPIYAASAPCVNYTGPNAMNVTVLAEACPPMLSPGEFMAHDDGSGFAQSYVTMLAGRGALRGDAGVLTRVMALPRRVAPCLLRHRDELSRRTLCRRSYSPPPQCGTFASRRRRATPSRTRRPPSSSASAARRRCSLASSRSSSSAPSAAGPGSPRWSPPRPRTS